MGKKEADRLHKITAKGLGMLARSGRPVSGTLQWEDRLTGKKDEVGVSADIGEMSMRLRYSCSSLLGGDPEHFDYEVRLERTPCHFGGYRYWFLCPVPRGNWPCGRRAGVLYLSGRYFGCRHCHNLTYSSRNEGGRWRKDRLYQKAKLLKKAEELERKMTTTHYAGKPTKTMRRLEKIRRKITP